MSQLQYWVWLSMRFGVRPKMKLALGLRGRAVGAALQACLAAVMDETLPNDRAALLAYAAENLQRFANS